MSALAAALMPIDGAPLIERRHPRRCSPDLRSTSGQVRIETARNAAFIVSLGLWGAFILAEEVLLAYPLEAVHLRLLTAQLATLLVLTLVPEQPPGSS